MGPLTLNFLNSYNSFNNVMSFYNKVYIYVNIFFLNVRLYLRPSFDFQASPKIYNSGLQKLSFHFVVTRKQHKGKTSQ